MNRTAMFLIAAAGVVGLSGGTVFAAEQTAKNSAIPEETARNFAFIDAGVEADTAGDVKTNFRFMPWKFVYDIEFTANDTDYGYLIDARSGRVIRSEVDGVEQERPAKPEGELPEGELPALPDGEQPALPDGEQPTLPEGEQPALPEGELPALPEGEQPQMNGQQPQMNGQQPQMNGQQPQMNGQQPQMDGQQQMPAMPEGEQPTLPEGELPALPEGEAPALPEGEQPQTNAEGQMPQMNGQGQMPQMNSQGQMSQMNDQGQMPAAPENRISLEDAKQIALDNAGVSADEATFSKAKITRDEGRMVFDIRFQHGDQEEEFQIDTGTGMAEQQ